MMLIKPAEFVCLVGQAPASAELINDAKAWTWEFEAEHLLLRLESGERAIVRGGRDGIVFLVKGDGDNRTLHMEIAGQVARVVWIYWHTPPRVTGPSDGDLDALRILGQNESRIYEIGGAPDGTRIGPKSARPSP